MKRLHIALIVLAIAIITFWIIGRITGAFQYCSSTTPSNYPTLKVGDRYFTSNLIEPERFDFISYHTNAVGYEGQMWVHRLCGIGGDTIKIKNGVLFVNGLNCDDKLSVSHFYKISKEALSKFKNEIEDERIIDQASDSLIVIFEDKKIKKQNITAVQMTEPVGSTNGYIQSTYGFDWNVDNFGPLVIPPDKYFVMGDNRHNSLDSRYTGLIDKSHFIATVIGKH